MQYVAFFRGINVGGKNKVKMADLLKVFEECGFSDAKTYIQSGNVLFFSDKGKSMVLNTISKAFLQRFGFESSVILYSAKEVVALLSVLPFTKKEIEKAQKSDPKVEHVYMYLSNDSILPAVESDIHRGYEGADKVYVGERVVYLLCFSSIRKCRLAASLAKMDIAQTLTIRNQKTMQKICAMLNVDE